MTDQEQQEQEAASLSVYLTAGATPYGQEVIQQLVAAGHSVTAFASTSKEAHTIRTSGALPVYGDESDVISLSHNLRLAEVDTLIHLKPMTMNMLPFMRRDWDALAAQMSKENEALFKAAEEAGVKFTVLTSFAYLYADGEGLDESAPAREAGNSEFLAAALAAEQKVMEMGGCVLRVGYLYGDEGLRTLAAQMRRGLPMPLGDETNMASWLRVIDLPEAVAAAAQVQPAEKIYNIAGDTPTSAYHFLEMVSEQTGINMPNRMPTLVANRVFGSTHMAILNANVAVSNDAAKTDLDWSPQYSDIAANLEEITLEWRANQALV